MLAAMFLPFVSQAQNTLTVADGTTTNSYVPVYGLYVDDFVRCQTIYPASEITDAATSYYMTGGTITGLTYYLSSPATDSWGTASFVVNIKEVSATTLSAFVDMTDATTVYTGSLDATQSTMNISFTTPYTYQGGNLLIEIYNTLEGTYKSASFYGITATGASWQGNNGTSVSAITGATRAFIPKTTFTFTGGTANTCPPVENLVATNITSTTATLSWSGNATGYTVYEYANVDSADYMYTDTFAVFNTLQPNTEYTFGVVADCGTDGESVMRSVTFRTACAAMSLPYTMGFEASDLYATTPNADALPFCWHRYASGTGSYTYYPYSYSSTSYAHGGSRLLYFYDGTGATYPDTMVAILPEIDVNTYPMNGNRLTFWGRVSTGTNTKNVQIGTMTDPTDMSTFVPVSTVAISGTTHTLYSVPLTTATSTAPYVAIMLVKSSSGYLCIDDVTLEEMPSCFEISGLATSNITSNSVDLSWSDNSNASTTTYSVYIIANGTQVLLDNNITGTNYTVTNLTPNTSYTFGVQANCASGDASVMTISATTACTTETMPWSENFDNWTAKSPCWSFLSGQYNGGAGTPTTSTSAWTLNTTYGSYITISGKALTMNLYSSNKYWAVTPLIEITGDALLTLDVAASAWSAAAPNYDDNDTLAIAISTDGGTTFSTLHVLAQNDLNALTGTYTTVYVPVTGYTGYNVRFAIYGGSTSGTSPYDNRIAIDNITISESTGDICYPVTNLSVVEMTSNSATISWNGTSADSYTVTVLDQSNQQVGTPLTQTDTSCVLTGLQMDNDYTVTVVANCGSDVSSASTISIHIGYCLPNPTSVDNSGITNITIGSMSNSTSHPTTSPYYINNSSMVASVPAGTTATVDITYATGYTYGTIIWVDWDNSMTFDGTEVVYAGESTNSNPTTLTATFEIPVSTTMGNYRMRIAGADSYFDNYTSSVTAAASANPCFSSSYAIVEDYTLAVTSAPNCLPVTDLAVDSVTANSVFLSWTGNASSYSIYSSTGAVVATGITTTSYTITGLTANTNYTFGVVANCSATDSSDVTLINVTTACVSTAINLPFTETFNATSTTRNCWNTIDADGDGACWSTFYQGMDQEIMISESYDNNAFMALNPDNWLVSPKLHSNANSEVTMTWFVGAADDTYYAEHYGVYVSTTSNTDTTAFTLVNEWTLTSDNGMSMSLDLSAYAGQDIYVAFRHFNCTDQYLLLIDSVSIFEGAIVPDSAHITIAVNDPTMGTTIPAPGTYAYADGEEFTITAVPANGYQLLDWAVTVTYDGETETEYLGTTDLTISDTAYAYFDMLNLVVTAIFGTDSIDPNADSMLVNIAVNDPTMGTTNPAPGAHYFHVGEQASVVAIPNTGYHLEGWTVNVTIEGVGTVMDTTLPYAINDFFEIWGGWEVEEGDGMYTWNVTANFAAGAAPETNDSLTVITSVNNAAWGTVTPAPGTHYYTEGQTFTMGAAPNEGYYIYAVYTTVTMPGFGTISDTAYAEDLEIEMGQPLYEEVEVDEEMIGMVIDIHFVFASLQGIENAEEVNINVYGNEGDIVLQGAEGREVYVFDVNGRMLHHTATANMTERYSVPATGVYLVKVEGVVTKRVVIVR